MVKCGYVTINFMPKNLIPLIASVNANISKNQSTNQRENSNTHVLSQLGTTVLCLKVPNITGTVPLGTGIGVRVVEGGA